MVSLHRLLLQARGAFSFRLASLALLRLVVLPALVFPAFVFPALVLPTLAVLLVPAVVISFSSNALLLYY